MVDTFEPEIRSRIMSAVRSSNTCPELAVRRELHQRGLRFVLHRKDLPGTPDIVLPKHRAIVFVQGCFWHGHGCSRSKTPVTNRQYWETKIARNRARDRRAQRRLRDGGWHVFNVWTCDSRRGVARVCRALLDVEGRPGHPS
ncbi:MAG: very short patch repair endonuclease [Chloroflexi bacterium HGW-Chloroflexi-9]|nr:MAG: very short patch repair endonuclease [Chloroflexi bacterium HGW-Chloroflexi-9]